MMKLRSVMLEFWGRPVPPALRGDLDSLSRRSEQDGGVLRELADVLEPVEMRALMERLHRMIEEPKLPVLDPYYNVPYPWV